MEDGALVVQRFARQSHALLTRALIMH
jgi:hypothetical protein